MEMGTQQNQVITAPIGIVGAGLGALMAYSILRFRGVKRDEIVIFSPDTSPEQSWLKFAQAINLRSLRSESLGHMFPTDSPGLATLEALKRRSLKPIIQSWFDRYHPTVDFFVDHVKTIARQTGFARSQQAFTIEGIEKSGETFRLYSENRQHVATVQHVILAIGHGLLHVPEPIQKFREQYPDNPGVNLSYETKTYGARTVLVMGDGITAAHEWANVIEAGGAIAAVSLNGFAFGQPLQVPRRYFSRRGLRPYRKRNDGKRYAELKKATRGTIPMNPTWKKLFQAAEKEGRLGLVQGAVKSIQPTSAGRLACEIEFSELFTTHTIEVDQVICATGFLPATTHPLLQSLITQYNLPTQDAILKTDDNCCLEALSTPGSILAVIGPASAWAVPCADSLGGMKIAARGLASVLGKKERYTPRALVRRTQRWAQVVLGKELV